MQVTGWLIIGTDIKMLSEQFWDPSCMCWSLIVYVVYIFANIELWYRFYTSKMSLTTFTNIDIVFNNHYPLAIWLEFITV